MQYLEGKKLIEEHKYEEALEYFTNEYQKFPNILCKYYICLLKFFYIREIDIIKDYKDFQSLLKLPKKFHPSILHALIFLSFDNEDFSNTIVYFEKISKFGIEDPFFYYAYAHALIRVKNNFIQAKAYLEKALSFEVNNVLYHDIIVLLFNCYFNMDDLENAKELLNKLYLKNEDLNLLNEIELQILLEEKKLDEAIKFLDSLDKSKQLYNKALLDTYIYAYTKNQFDHANELRTKLLELPNIDFRLYIVLKLDFAYTLIFHHRDYKKAIILLEDTEVYKVKENDLKHRHAYLQIYALELDNPFNHFDKIVKINDEIWDTQKYTAVFDKFIEYLFGIKKYDYLDKYLNLFKKYCDTIPNGKKIYDSFSYFDIRNKLINGKFDEVKKNLNYVFKNKFLGVFDYYYFLDKVSSNKGYLYIYQKLLKTKPTNWAQREYYLYVYYEKFKDKLDYNLLLNQMKELADNNSNDSCYLTSYGVLLWETDKNKAFEIFKQSYEMILKDPIVCGCGVAYYSYFLYNGIGCEENKELAKKIVNDFYLDRTTYNRLCEDELVMYLIAYYNLKENINLEYSYEILQKINLTKYDYNKYLLMSKIEKILFNEPKKETVKLMKKAYKLLPNKNKKFYLNHEDDIFLML